MVVHSPTDMLFRFSKQLRTQLRTHCVGGWVSGCCWAGRVEHATVCPAQRVRSRTRRVASRRVASRRGTRPSRIITVRTWANIQDQLPRLAAPFAGGYLSSPLPFECGAWWTWSAVRVETDAFGDESDHRRGDHIAHLPRGKPTVAQHAHVTCHLIVT